MRTRFVGLPLRRATIVLCLGYATWMLAADGASAAKTVPNTSTVPSAPTEPNWARYASSCDEDGGSDLAFCGNFGKYQFGTIEVPRDCAPVAVGSALLRPYPPPITPTGPAFPYTSNYLEDLGTTVPGAVSSGSKAKQSIQDWLAVIDFDDDHGWSTTFLANSTAGSGIVAVLVPLDKSEPDALGSEVNDFHVLRALCSIVDRIDRDGARPPVAVNMSFGRLKADNETWYSSTCRSGAFACQIAQVIGDLSVRGTKFVAAAGNHGEMLFPAGLPDVTAVGMLDIHSLVNGGSNPAVWETPAGVNALAPGNHLCLDESWPAPGGASYSSAMFAGWYAGFRSLLPDGGSSGEEFWVPEWNPVLGCYVPSSRGVQIAACNPEISALFGSLDGTLENPCWAAQGSQVAAALRPGSGVDPPDIPSFDHWSEAIHPTPSGDPCVPCVANSNGRGPSGSVLEINLCESRALDPSVYIVEVYVKTLAGFEQVPLTTEELEALRAGTLDRLDLSGYEFDDPATSQPSLWYQLSDEPYPDCSGGSQCFWDSSNILIGNSGN